MLGFDSIAFDLEGWRAAPPVAGTVAHNNRAWTNHLGDELSVHLLDRPPDLPAPLTDIAKIRNGYRTSVAAKGGGLVSVNTPTIAGLTAVETVFKYPQRPHGMTYVGAMTFAFRDFSLVVRVTCREAGITGLRDSAVLIKMLSAGTVAILTDGTPRMVGWAQDPYDPCFTQGALRNRADDERWDADFPNHPLSRVRACLTRIRATCRLAADLESAAKFDGAQADS